MLEFTKCRQNRFESGLMRKVAGGIVCCFVCLAIGVAPAQSKVFDVTDERGDTRTIDTSVLSLEEIHGLMRTVDARRKDVFFQLRGAIQKGEYRGGKAQLGFTSSHTTSTSTEPESDYTAARL